MRPFTLAVPEADLADLRERLARTRWPHELPGVGWERGIPVGHLRRIAEHWRDDFDWRAQERRLNELPQFTTTIDGQELHFFHVRSPEPDALPLVMTHGWPSTAIEFQRAERIVATALARRHRTLRPRTTSRSRRSFWRWDCG